MSEKYARKIKKPDKEEAEKTFVGNCAGKIIFLCGNPAMAHRLWDTPCFQINLGRTFR